MRQIHLLITSYSIYDTRFRIGTGGSGTRIEMPRQNRKMPCKGQVRDLNGCKQRMTSGFAPR